MTVASKAVVLAVLLLLAGCGGATDEAAPAPAESEPMLAAPDLSACPKAVPVDDGLRQRTAPIEVPAGFAQMVASGMDHFAVSTLTGGTVCVDTAWIEDVEEMALSADRRFLGFGWSGYEAFGHVVVDRAGKGTSIDTGTTPAFSPDGRHIAAADIDESGYGALGGFAVWEVTPGGTSQIAKFAMDGLFSNGSTARWQGNGCVELEVVQYEHLDDATNTVVPERTPRWHATAAVGWEPQPGACPPA